MHLIDITLRNFGVYRGTNTIGLEPINGPIVIIGGKNGAGKTTILEAIRLCLYGKRTLGSRVSRREYEEYIANRIHHQVSALIQSKFASVELSFEYSQFGLSNKYKITRAWELRANGVIEQLYVKVDSKPLTSVPEEMWQEFINDIIPLGVADLLFFDSEKIQLLATDGQGDKTLGEEIKRLLNVNVIEGLLADLNTYTIKQRRAQSLPELTKNLDNLQTIKGEIESQFQAKRQDRAQTQTWKDRAQAEIERLERRLHQESSGYALSRETLKKNLASIDAEIAQIEREIHNFSAGLLPFALVPEILNQLKDQLQNEAQFEQWQVFNALVQSRVTAVKESFRKNHLWKELDGNLSTEEQNAILFQFDLLLDEVARPEDSIKHIKLIHSISERERLQLLNWIEQAQIDIPQQIRRAGKRLEHVVREREKLNAQLRMVPDEIVLGPMIEELNEQYRKMGILEATATRQDEEVNSLEFQRIEASRRLQKAVTELRGGEALERRLELVEKTKKVLDHFLKKMIHENISKLEILIAERFNELSRKPYLVKRVEIDPEEFKISLIGRDGQILPKTQLSAGEKQLFAISTLWALRILSGRPLPIVIDTPLAHLDSEHRMNLIEQYFPYSSHQMILLSTDTEVDQKYFKLLDNHISHAYHLDYDSEKGATNVRNGYFWNEVEYAIK